MSSNQYEKDVIRYKKKYVSLRRELRHKIIDEILALSGYSNATLPNLLSNNSDELKEFVIAVCQRTRSARGNINSIWYSGVVSELLDICGIGYDIHIGFVLPVKVVDTSKYDCSLVNYMYIVGDNGVKYHCFNGILDDTNFTYFSDNVVEV